MRPSAANTLPDKRSVRELRREATIGLGASSGVDNDTSGEDVGSEADDDGEREAAATVIQQTWRSFRSDANDAIEELDLSDTGELTAQATACCIVCFALIPQRSLASPVTHDSAGENEEVSVCVDCAQRMTCSNPSATPGASKSVCSDPAVPSRLSHLLRVEAKVNDQLQLLRDQHRLLLAQQEQLLAAKRAKAEQEAEARALARQRRRQVRMLLERRKREEEEKFRQFMSLEHGSDVESGAPPSVSMKKKAKKKPKEPTPATAAADSTPSDPFESAEAPLALPVTPSQAEKKADKRVSCMQDEIQEHARQLWQRRKQTLDCYSQDLSPLVNGSKPKRLPVPAALLTLSNPTSKLPKKTTKSSGPWTASPTVGQSSNQPTKTRRAKKTHVKLRPLANGARARGITVAADATNNQLDELDPSYYGSVINSSSSPLTAEIKPVSWIYELGKDLIACENEEEDADANLLHGNLAGLPSVIEECGGYDDDREAILALFPPLVRQLPAPVAVSTLPGVSTLGGVPAQATRGWEYSSERLAGLLEKYNVTVKEATAEKVGRP